MYLDHKARRTFGTEGTFGAKPKWAKEEDFGWQMWEEVSEGSPISPVCQSPEELARWLADNGASAGGNSTATYEQWLAMIAQGGAPSLIVSRSQDGAVSVRSGVEAAIEGPES